MTNFIALLALLSKLMPFLKEVFITNKDFRDAVLANRSVLGIFFACIVLFSINLDQMDTLTENHRKLREMEQRQIAVSTEHSKLTAELSALKDEVFILRDDNHQYAIDLAEARLTIQLREESMAELKETINSLREQLGHNRSK